METNGASRPNSSPFTKSETLSDSGHNIHDDERDVSTLAPAVACAARLLDRNPQMAQARATYLRIFLGGLFITILLIFAVFPIFWGSLWKIPARNLNGWIVDFDGGLVGNTISQALSQSSSLSKVSWEVKPASMFPGGAVDVMEAVRNQETWVALAVSGGATTRLNSALSNPNATYDGSEAITVFAVEARNENAYRSIIRPSVQASLDAVTKSFSIKVAQQSASLTNLATILTTSPQTIVSPISYQLHNLIPFDIPVATAVTFVGLLYQLILTFFIVMVASAARDASDLSRILSLRCLIGLRLVSAFIAYFFLSLFYTLLNVAFQLPLTRRFGGAGFLIFWMLNMMNMLSVGLALESLHTLLTTSFIPFFMLLWIISNVSVVIFPIEVLPTIFRYGYATPFYNVSQATRTVVFGTKNEIGKHCGILFVWIIISLITLPLFQWLVRTRAASSHKRPAHSQEKHDSA